MGIRDQRAQAEVARLELKVLDITAEVSNVMCEAAKGQRRTAFQCGICASCRRAA